jgi:hypothetical protein
MPSLSEVRVEPTPNSGVGGIDVSVGGIGVFVGKGVGVAVGKARCVSASVVLTVEMADSIRSAWLIVGVDRKLLQEASMAARNKEVIVLWKIFIFHFPLMLCEKKLIGLQLFQLLSEAVCHGPHFICSP